jgi:hypothetical protein
MTKPKVGKGEWSKATSASGPREINLLGQQIENRDGVYIGTVTSIVEGQVNYMASNGDLGHAPSFDVRVRGSSEPFPEPRRGVSRIARPLGGSSVATPPRQKRKDAVPDAVSELLAGKTPDEVLKIATEKLGFDCKAKYGHLNNGQIRMQCGNQLRQLMKRGLL